MAIQRTHTGTRTKNFFSALIHRRGERFNQSVIAFTKQDSGMSHFPEARNVTSSCETRRNGGSYYFGITSTALFILSRMLSNRGGPNNAAAFLRAARGVCKNKHVQPRMLSSQFNTRVNTSRIEPFHHRDSLKQMHPFCLHGSSCLCTPPPNLLEVGPSVPNICSFPL